MEIPKDQILSLLRDRGQHDQAQQADQELPDKVDTDQHGDLLSRFGIDPQELISKYGGQVAGDIGKKLGL
jgi:hypothetical protein